MTLKNNLAKRVSKIKRKTKETDILIEVNIDGGGEYSIETPLPFITHMLEQLSKHSSINIKIKCFGDTEIDAHHTVEDLGWALGEAINKALKDKKGILRYASINLPMDETLTSCSVDVAGRPWLIWKVIIPNAKIGGIDSEVFREFFQSFSQASRLTIHINNLYGNNAHHIIESCFKSLAVCLKRAFSIDLQNVDIIPSTKGRI